MYGGVDKKDRVSEFGESGIKEKIPEDVFRATVEIGSRIWIGLWHWIKDCCDWAGDSQVIQENKQFYSSKSFHS